MGITGLVLTVIGAGISVALGTFQWVVGEELQRQNLTARRFVDIMKARTRA